jgi:hypothetical protein
MQGIQTQGVNLIFAGPMEGALQKEAPHFIAFRPVEIEYSTGSIYLLHLEMELWKTGIDSD